MNLVIVSYITIRRSLVYCLIFISHILDSFIIPVQYFPGSPDSLSHPQTYRNLAGNGIESRIAMRKTDPSHSPTHLVSILSCLAILSILQRLHPKISKSAPILFLPMTRYWFHRYIPRTRTTELQKHTGEYVIGGRVNIELGKYHRTRLSIGIQTQRRESFQGFGS